MPQSPGWIFWSGSLPSLPYKHPTPSRAGPMYRLAHGFLPNPSVSLTAGPGDRSDLPRSHRALEAEAGCSGSVRSRFLLHECGVCGVPVSAGVWVSARQVRYHQATQPSASTHPHFETVFRFPFPRQPSSTQLFSFGVPWRPYTWAEFSASLSLTLSKAGRLTVSTG